MSKCIFAKRKLSSPSTTCDTKRENFQTSITSNSSNNNTFNKNLLLKMKTYTPMMKVISPSRSLRLDIINEKLNRGASKSERNSLSLTGIQGLTHSYLNTGTLTTSCGLQKKSKSHRKLTLKKINEEIKNIHQFIQQSPCGYDDNKVLQQLRIKQSRYRDKMSNNFNFSSHNEHLSLRTKKKRRLVLNNENDQKWQQFVNVINNPSYGIDGIKKEFPHYINNHSIKVNTTFGKRYESKSLATTMIAFRTDKKSENLGKFDLKKKNKLTQASRLKLKCKTIKWFIDNKKDLLNRLLEPRFQEQILKFSEKKSREFHSGLTIEEFATLMHNNKITNDPSLIEKLFWIFDEDGDNDLKYSEIASGIEMFRDTSPEEKVKVFFRLCDTDGSNSISKQEFYTMLKRNIIDKDDIRSLKKSVEKIFNLYGGDVELSIEQLTEGFQSNKDLENIINKNMLSLKSIDTVIDNDVKKDLMRFTEAQNLFLKQKLYGGNCETCPIKDNKFKKLVEEFIDKKEKINAINTKKDEYDEEDSASYDYENFDNHNKDEEDLFKEEREIYDMVINLDKNK